ncbi:MAG TPA: hypothetical protein P5568_08755 [Acidobacteriota bacterium]|nr:hypothetical protein [Acidobacteriota bacterium]
MIKAMEAPVIRRLLFTVMFPDRETRSRHVSRTKLQSLLRRQLSDQEIIETIDHLFACSRCFETYRCLRRAYLGDYTTLAYEERQ